MLAKVSPDRPKIKNIYCSYAKWTTDIGWQYYGLVKKDKKKPNGLLKIVMPGG